MNVILTMSTFWTAYGIVGILGFQVIRREYRGHSWTRSYIRLRGVSWLLLGIPWLLLNRIAAYTSVDIGTDLLCFILLVLAMPSIIIAFLVEKKYRNVLKNEQKNTAT